MRNKGMCVCLACMHVVMYVFNFAIFFSDLNNTSWRVMILSKTLKTNCKELQRAEKKKR